MRFEVIFHPGVDIGGHEKKKKKAKEAKMYWIDEILSCLLLKVCLGF